MLTVLPADLDISDAIDPLPDHGIVLRLACGCDVFAPFPSPSTPHEKDRPIACPAHAVPSLANLGLLEPRIEVFTCAHDHPPVCDRTRTRYLVTHKHGKQTIAWYCDDCAALAASDWNGETGALEVHVQKAPCAEPSYHPTTRARTPPR